MIDLSITFTEHDGALRFRAEADPAKSTPLENATACLVALFLEREMNLFFATAQRALSRGVVVAPDPESNSAKVPQVLPSAEAAPADRPATTSPSSPSGDTPAPTAAPASPDGPGSAPAVAPLPPPEIFEQPGD